MKGSIRKKGKQSWQLQVYKGRLPDGKPDRYFETIRGPKRDAEYRLNVLLAELGRGNLPSPSKLTLSKHLEDWLDGYVKTNCSIRTHDGYKAIIDNHLSPALGNHLLKNVNQQQIQAYYGKALETLSSRTVHHQHRVLSQAFKYAVRQGYLSRNPCDLVDPPSPKGKAMRTLVVLGKEDKETGEYEVITSEVEGLLTAAEGSYYYPVIYTAVSSGLWQAELLGLRWRDVDISSPSISVNQVLYKRRGRVEFNTPKTEHSRRTVSMTPNLAEFFGRYRLERERLYHQLGRTITLDDLVFASAEGKPLNPPSLSRDFKRIVKKAGLENVRFHDLRHTFASLMLLMGVSPKVVSEALGHASVAFTLATYSHILPGMQRAAMVLLNRVLPAAADQITPNYANRHDYGKVTP